MCSAELQPKSHVKSHIQMPRLLLKRFHNKNHRFFYYDVQRDFVGTKGSARSTNAQEGYYSSETELYLSECVETPFGEILAYIDNVDFGRGHFEVPQDFDRATRNFIYALMARDPVVIEEIEKKSALSCILPAQNRHDYAAVNGIHIVSEGKVFEDYTFTFMVNRTNVPFVLTMAGLYDYRLNGHRVMNLPISPDKAICAVDKEYAEKMIRADGTMLMFMIESPEAIMRMNDYAFARQKERNWGYIVCPEREELDRLQRESFLLN